jgi:pimeloyl-ACP methyl ester carboxylesterase
MQPPHRLLLVILLFSGVCGCVHTQPLPTALQHARTLDGRELPPGRGYWTAFRNPSQYNATGLYLLQPYQPGRIPLILIHGLASDALTWEETVTALNLNPEIVARYQIWLYQYPTGLTYLRTAADLRKELLNVRSIIDPNGVDSAIDQTVLVGHSMGGLMAKLQVSYSDDVVWRAISDVPLNEAIQSGPVPEETIAAVLFQPVPFVKKVVYMATPHQGSTWTQQPLGQIGRWLINIPEQIQKEYSGLVRGNPGLIRNPAARPPTSLDHLTPGNNIIRATNSLRYSSLVQTHSIVGTGYFSPDGCRGDGVVPLVSARRPDVRTECCVRATHSGILRSPAAAAELACILTRMD